MMYECERHCVIQASAERVWTWLQSPQHLFSLNLFHQQVDETVHSLQVGSQFVIQHSFFGLYRQTRVARIRVCRPYHVAWGEFAATGRDWFPHSQSLVVHSLTANACLLINRLRGQFRLKGADYWLMPVYRWVGPWILDAENRKIDREVKLRPHVLCRFEKRALLGRDDP